MVGDRRSTSSAHITPSPGEPSTQPGNELTGSCLCGSIAWRSVGHTRPVIECHCHRCQKITGNHMAATEVHNDRLAIEGDTLRWYSPADDQNVAYGFCHRCGSSLFYRSGIETKTNQTTSICAGSIDGPSGLTTAAVWWWEQAADHQRFPADAEVFPTEPPGIDPPGD